MSVDRQLKKHIVFMDIARSLSQLGTCDRKYVGALIVRDGRCVSWGFNGAPPGAPHCSENGHGWKDEAIKGSAASGYTTRLKMILDENGCRNATHAEANALAFAARQGISTDGAILYVTVSPCDVCARLLIAAGISDVIYSERYRDDTGTEILRGSGIPCRALTSQS